MSPKRIHHLTFDRWVSDLRTEMVTGMSPQSLGAIVTAIGASSPLLTTAASAVTTGGMNMTAIHTAAAATSSATAKIAAGTLSVALAASGAAAVTGNLPSGAQTVAADLAAHIGIELPRPDIAAGVAGRVDAALADIVDVAGAGRIGVTLGDTGLIINGVEATAGFTASIVAETADMVIVEFRSATETVRTMLTSVDGHIVASSTTESSAGKSNSSTEAEAGLKSETTDGKSSTEAEAEVGVGVTIGG